MLGKSNTGNTMKNIMLLILLCTIAGTKIYALSGLPPEATAVEISLNNDIVDLKLNAIKKLENIKNDRIRLGDLDGAIQVGHLIESQKNDVQLLKGKIVIENAPLITLEKYVVNTRWSWGGKGIIQFKENEKLMTSWGSGTWTMDKKTDVITATWNRKTHKFSFSDDRKSFVSKRTDGDIVTCILLGK
jgi:hypothetical protein